MAKSKQILSAEEIRTIKVMADIGNSVKVISEVLKVPATQITEVLEHLYKYQDALKAVSGMSKEQSEAIGDFERIIKNKKSSAMKGKELWNSIKARSVDYKQSWEADSSLDFNFGNRYIALCFASDFHIGHEGVAYKRLEEDMAILRDTKGMYMIFGGDFIDNFIDGSKHQEAVLNSIAPPKDQVALWQYLLSIIGKPNTKILYVVKDNHVTARLKKACGIDWSNKLWEDHGVFYGGEEILANIQIGKIRYRVVSRHSFRGKSNVHLTASAKSLFRNGKHEDIDIVSLGHTHEGSMEAFFYRGNPKLAVQCSTYKTLDPYSQQLGFQEPTIFMPAVILSPDRKEFTICSSMQEARTMLLAVNRGRK